MPIEALKDWHRTHAGPYLTHTIGLVATDGSQTIQRFGKVASYAAAALVFAQALAEWPGSRILWRMAHGAWRMAHGAYLITPRVRRRLATDRSRQAETRLETLSRETGEPA